MTVLVAAALARADALVEIEVTAVDAPYSAIMRPDCLGGLPAGPEALQLPAAVR